VPGRARQISSSTCKRQVALKEVGAAKATPTLREEMQASAFPGERDALATFYTLGNAQKVRPIFINSDKLFRIIAVETGEKDTGTLYSGRKRRLLCDTH
jgi:hypothetical protein